MDAMWEALRECARRARGAPGTDGGAGAGAGVDAMAMPVTVAVPDQQAGWVPAPGLSPQARDFVSLYLPLCAASARRPVTIAHLGQSLDGCVATASGDSVFVNDEQNIVHLHRLRALCDAVVVGGATAREDDPRLTTRLVPGDNPLRVIIDPRLELDPALKVFNDGAAPTLVVCLEGAITRRRGPGRAVDRLAVPADDGGRPDLARVTAGLRTRGCHAVLVEGGGVTVSRFLAADLLDRLQIAVAPLFIGAGRAGLQVPASVALRECLRPSHRVFRMGRDLLFDCDLRAGPGAQVTRDRAPREV